MCRLRSIKTATACFLISTIIYARANTSYDKTMTWIGQMIRAVDLVQMEVYTAQFNAGRERTTVGRGRIMKRSKLRK